MANVIGYIDGFNLYHGLRDRYQNRYQWLDLVKLMQRLRPHDSIVAVRYFTALVRDDPSAQARQQAYLGALRAHRGDRLEIVHGRYQAKQQTCRACGASRTSYEEKETDVNIAVSLVADAATAAADLAVLVSADSDLCPAIRTARLVSAGRPSHFGIIAVFPPRRFSHELRQLIPGAFTLSHQDIRNSLLPDTVTDVVTGRKFYRPQAWY